MKQFLNSWKHFLFQRASRSLLRQVYVGLLNHQKTYKNQCKINTNQSGLIKSSCWVILARPGSSMVHFGPSRRSMEVDLGHLGSSWVHLGLILGSSWLILGSCWVILGSSWAHLSSSWAHLGSSWVILGHLGLILGSSLVILGHLGLMLGHLGSILDENL